MLAQLPSNMLITRVKPSVYLSVAAFVWSLVSGMTALCTNAGGLFAVQIVLGIVEAPLFPGAVFLMSCWYVDHDGSPTELSLLTLSGISAPNLPCA